MELRQLEYFVAVAEEGGFARAAGRIGIVQSAVSRQVRLLEREWGVTLFERSTRHVRLSGAGERLLPEARAVLAAARRAGQVAAGLAGGAQGVLRLGAVQGPGGRMYGVLDELAARAPELQVVLRRLPPAERLAAVRTGELDAAFVRAVRTAEGLELLPVWRDPLYVALPSAHVTAGDEGPGVTLDALVRSGLSLRLAPRAKNPPFHDLVTDALREAGARQPLLGPPFTTLQETLTAIGAEAVAAGGSGGSWTVFYEAGALPSLPRVAIRPLDGPALTTSLAVRPGPPGPSLRELLLVTSAARP
ncbi:LysR family transcriptional regulator [Streptomyces luteocolor]|uniref:LysR family transcriptional regulator n=1 Tax=Streptomyces luteocolor TaxID=285500 RepID=UPI0008537C99|nr:LysR family transcriptional regulator [Streptomyces luteocolor]